MLYQLFLAVFGLFVPGLVLEVAATAVRLGQYRDRGVLHGPLCLVYGITGCLITIALRELSGGWFFLFLFSALYATVVEWIAGHLLEHYSHTRWWDYSDCKWTWMGTSAFRLPSSGVPGPGNRQVAGAAADAFVPAGTRRACACSVVDLCHFAGH